MKKIQFTFIIAFLFSLSPNLNAQTCMDQKFVGSFVDAQSCIDSNDIFLCGSLYTLIGGAAGAMGALYYEGYAGTRKPKLPVSLTPEMVDKYFKQSRVNPTLGLVFSTDQLNDETIKSLKKKGYKVDEIEKIRESLVKYRSSLYKAQDTVANFDDVEAKTRVQFQQDLARVEKGLKSNPNDEGLLAEKKAIQARTAALESAPKMSGANQLLLNSPGWDAQKEILALRQRPESAFKKSLIRGGVGGAVTGLGIALGPFIVDEVSVQKCKDKMGFKNDADLSGFRSFGAVDFSSCRSEINPHKVWDLLLMNPQERNELFKKSPALCQAFENSFINKINYLNKRKPEINLDATRCEDGIIKTEIKVRDRIYQQTITLQKIGMKLEGTFVAGNSFDLKDFEKFSMELKNDLSWTGVHTTNPTWGGIPGVQDNFKSMSAASNLEVFENFEVCEVLKGSDPIDRKMVNNPGSSRKLMCAVNEQAVAAKTVLPRLLDYCEKKSQHNLNTFSEKAKAIKEK